MRRRWFPGKLFFGWVSDKASIKLCMICVIAAQFVGQLLMYLSETTGCLLSEQLYLALELEGSFRCKGYCWKDFWQIEFWICSRHYATGDVSDSDSRCSLCRFGF